MNLRLGFGRTLTISSDKCDQPEGQRFGMIRNRGAEDAGDFIVVENFFEELKATVGN